MVDVKEWADTRAGNGILTPPDYPKEGMDKSDVNDTMRENMAAIRSWYQDQTFIDLFASSDEEWTISRISDTVVRVAGPSDPSGDLVVDRRVKITSSGGPTTVYGFVESLGVWGTGFVDVTVEIDDSGAVPVDTDQIEVLALKLGRVVTRNVGSGAAEVPDGDALTASITANVSDKSAALKDYADGFDDPADSVPLYSQLGTVCDKDHGTADGEVPLVSDLPAVLGDLAVLDRPGRVRGEVTSYQSAGGVTDRSITELSNLTIPGADGVKEYEVEILIFMNRSGTPDDIDLELRVGATGDHTDALAHIIPWDTAFFHFGQDDPYGFTGGGDILDTVGWLHRIVITPGPGEKASILWNPQHTSDVILEGSWVEIREIFWES